MQKRVSQIEGDYCFNLINSLIDYKGDIARNSKRSDGRILYSPDFSPNNIRRLILSADGARIDFHVSVDGRMSKVKPFSDAERMNLNTCLMLPDYKPMVWVLADRVCSSIEEVIICTQSSTNADLSRELNFEGLLRNRVQSYNDIQKAVSSRYKRLAYFTIVNCDINTLVTNPEVVSCNSSTKMITETNFVRGISTFTKFKDDWYNYYGHTSAYSLDSNGSRLNEHFKKIKLDIEDGKKKSEVEKLRNERLKGVSDKFNRAYKNYKGIMVCVRKLNTILKTEGVCFYADSINKYINIHCSKSPDEIKVEFESLHSRDDYEQYIKNLVKVTSAMYSDLARWFFEGLCTINKDYPLTVSTCLNEVDRAITVPPCCADLSKSLGKEFTGVSIVDSASNICCYSCIIFITDEGSHDMSKYYKKDTWLKNFDGGDN